jgi:DNA-binding phage protein
LNARGKRIYRQATSEELARHALVREQVAAELPEIKRRGLERLDLLKKAGTSLRQVPLRQVLAALRDERERQGLSLADINARTGIDRAALSRLENNQDANPTLATLERYAEAIGKQLIVLLSDSDIRKP